MSYKVTVHNFYKDGDQLRVTFDTNSKLLHEASRDGDEAIIQARLGQQKDPFETPVKVNRTYRPFS